MDKNGILVEKYEEYIFLLNEEIEDLLISALAYGWSDEKERSKKLEKIKSEIENLKSIK